MGKQKLFKVKISCAGCTGNLFTYTKEGPGRLIKCYTSNIEDDQTKTPGVCPVCEQQFAREGKIGNRPILKIIQGRIHVKGRTGKK